MQQNRTSTVGIALIVALGGFLMGFDASVISGVVGAIETEFSLTKLELGWAVASLTLTASLAMLVSGPLSDRFGRCAVLKVAAVMFAVSALASALAYDFMTLVLARMLGGFGVGAALIIAPMYIAEIAPAARRGQLVSFNQLNIVIGISVAFFSNYLILQLAASDTGWVADVGLSAAPWRWMLGVEAVPAIVYFFALWLVPESPRWLMMHERDEDAKRVFTRIAGAAVAAREMAEISASLKASMTAPAARIGALFTPRLRRIMTIGLVIAALQQIVGINAIFFYAPMIFEQSGIGTDAAFVQAILVGLVNLVFTVAAMLLIDRLGRRPLLGFGLAGIVICMALLSLSFASATYDLDAEAVAALPVEIDRQMLEPVTLTTYHSDVEFREALRGAIGTAALQQHQSALVSAAISVPSGLVLIATLGFVASFAFSLGPVMWVLFSELFPNQLRGLAISLAGLVNSAVSFGVQLVFPWELESLGNATTFAIYGAFALAGLIFVLRVMPETKGRTLEALERELVNE